LPLTRQAFAYATSSAGATDKSEAVATVLQSVPFRYHEGGGPRGPFPSPAEAHR